MARELKFPRGGAWAVWLRDGAEILGVINRIGKEDVETVSEPDPATGTPRDVNKTVFRVSEPFAEFHQVETADGANHGITVAEHKNVPFDQLRQATYPELLTQRRAADTTPLYAHRRGYDVGEELRAQIPAMEQAEALEIARSSAVAEHPDMTALDEKMAIERAALEAKFAQLRAQVAGTIDPDAEIARKAGERAARELAKLGFTLPAGTVPTPTPPAGG